MNYRTDEDKAQSIFTRPLDWAIKTFQSDEGLEQDGWLRPGGPTEQRLGKRLKQSLAPDESKLARTILPKLYDDDIVSAIKGWEGAEEKLYLDHLGNPTIGIGFMIPNAEQAKTYPFYKKEGEEFTRHATSDEIESVFETVKKQPFGKGYSKTKYSKLTDIGMKEEDMTPRFKAKLRSSADRLEDKFPDFSNKPKDIQFGLLDMEYNMNNNFQREIINQKTNEKKGWPGLFDAYDANDYKEMARQSHRRDVQDERNNKIFEKFFNAK